MHTFYNLFFILFFYNKLFPTQKKAVILIIENGAQTKNHPSSPGTIGLTEP